MAFDPKPGQELSIEGTIYTVAEHPAAPGFPFGQEGRAAVVYKLETTRGPRALKVFKSRFRTPDLASLTIRIAPYASIPGLSVCRRSVLTPQQHSGILRKFPDLTYSVLMPWIDGPTWLQVLQDKTPFSLNQSLSLSQALAKILSEMEQQGVAHCDLSSANLILPFLVQNEETTTYAPIEIVDVEQIFAKNLDQPETVPSGSDGYAHKSIRQGKIWNAKVDRFAGALLLVEMLGWCDPTIRNAAWGESYFDPQELQRNSRRYSLLHSSIINNWGDNAAGLLEQAWQSQILADCPTFGEWMVAIPDPEAILPKGMTPIPVDTPAITVLISLAAQMEEQDNPTGALETYKSVLTLLSDDNPKAKIIKEKIQSLVKKPAEIIARGVTRINAQDDDIPVAVLGSNRITCPSCEKLIPIESDICPYCEQAIASTAGETILPPEEMKERLPVLGGNGSVNGDKPNGGVTSDAISPNTHKNGFSQIGTENVDLSTDQSQDGNTQKETRLRLVRSSAMLVIIGIIIFTALSLNANKGTAPQSPSIISENSSVIPPPIVSGHFVSDRDGKREIYRLEGSGAVRVTNSPDISEAWDPFITPSGSVYFTSTRDGKREIYRLEGSGAVRVTNSPDTSEAWDPFITPSGSVYFTSTRDGKREIYRLEPGGAVRVTNSPEISESWDPFITPSGSLYFTSTRDGKREIYRLEPGGAVRVTNSPGISEAWDPFITPSGNLYFTATRDGKREIYRLEGSGAVRVTYSPTISEAWDPYVTSSGSVYFTAIRDGKREIYRLEDSGAVHVTNTPGDTESWYPIFR